MADWKEVGFALLAGAAAITTGVVIADQAAEVEARRKERLRKELKDMPRRARLTFEQVQAKPAGIKRGVFADEAIKGRVIDSFRYPEAHAQLKAWAKALEPATDRKPGTRRVTAERVDMTAKLAAAKLRLSSDYHVRQFAKEADKGLKGLRMTTFFDDYTDRASARATEEEETMMTIVLAAL